MKKIRCQQEECQKKLTIVEQTTGKCKCQNVFCMKHRFPKQHKCTFDHRGSAKEILIKNNPVVKSQKIVKI